MDKKTLIAIAIGAVVTILLIYLTVLREERRGQWNEKRINEYKQFQQQMDQWEKNGKDILSNTNSY